MNPLLLHFLISLACLSPLAMSQEDPQGAWKRQADAAERAFQNGSYQAAQEGFAGALEAAPEGADRRWLTFREVDSRLRSLDSAESRDSSQTDAALEELRALCPDQTAVEARDRVWAEAQEALGDHFVQARRSWGFGAGEAPYAAALDWWAASSDIDLARQRWLGIVFKMGWPAWSEGDSSYGERNHWVPMERLEQGLSIANQDEQRARLNFMIGRHCMRFGDGPWWDRRMRVAFDAIRAQGPKSRFFEPMAWFEAQWFENDGPWTRDAEGNASRQPDPARALEGYRAIVQAGRAGKNTYYRAAKEAVERILAQGLSLDVNQAFLTGSKVGYSLRVRNIDEVALTLTPIRLHEAVQLNDREDHAHQWLESLTARGNEPRARWKVDTTPDAPYQYVDKFLPIDGDIPAGSYLLEAQGGGRTAKALVLVTEAGITLKVAKGDLYSWVTDARTGAPLQNIDVHIQARVRDRKGKGTWLPFEARTPENGLAHIEAPESRDQIEYFVSVETPKGPAFGVISAYQPGEEQGWRVHVITDRPAYRPDQTVQWKLSARLFTGLEYTTPAGRKLQAKLIDPRGTEVDQAEITLSAFGSAFGTFATGSNMPLGQYGLKLMDGDDQVGWANLFRLEEYKRPEFEVTVATPKDDSGRAHVYVLGDEVRAEIRAQTYFGSPVAGAKVEWVLYRMPYYGRPTPRGKFQWFSDCLTPEWERSSRYPYWNREEVSRAEAVTDEQGLCTLRFSTPYGVGTDFEYSIEARVTDASRREVTGNGTVRVRRQAYTAELELEHRIHRIGGQATLTVHTQDANDVPLPVQGTLHLYKARWVEVWAGPDGLPVPQDTLRSARQRWDFPPPNWERKRGEYVFEEVDSLELTTDAEGLGTWSPTLAAEGTYQFRWISPDPRSGEVTAEIWTFVASSDSMDLGYNQDGLMILLDKSSVAEGEPAQILIMSDASDRYVLFSVEAERILSIDVVHLAGNVKLVTLPITQQHVPNVVLTATEIRNAQIRQVQQALVVPPKKHFLDVAVQLDQEAYRPGAEGSFQVTVLDSDGQPVQAEVSLSLFDGSLLGIAPDQIEDPRALFWGQRRNHQVQTGGSLFQWSYTNLVLDSAGRLMTPQELQVQTETGIWDGATRDALKSKSQGGRYRGAGDTVPPAGAAMSSNGPASPGPGVLGEEAARESAEDSVSFRAFDTGGVAGGEMEPGANPSQPAITVRSDFRETAFWLPSLITDASGHAAGSFTLPESTTRWQLNGFAGDRGDRFGQLREAAARTELPLILRPQMPRFLVQGDQARVSALVTNTTDSAIACAVDFEAKGLRILGHFDGETRTEGTRVDITVPPHGDARIDYLVEPTAIGAAELRFTALSQEVSDGVLRTLPVIEHGIEVFVADSGRLVDARIEHTFDLPAGVEGRTHMEVRVAPSVATTMLDALPYLTQYPYGCLEQTLSRFVPTAVSMRTLEKLGLDPEWVAKSAFGGIELDHVDRTQPLGREAFDKFQEAAAAGLAKVEGDQRSDGSWGWWTGGPSDRWMTGYAAWSLALAKEAGLEVSVPGLQRALQWIERALVEPGQSPDDKLWLLHSACAVRTALDIQEPSEFLPPAFADVYARRAGLSAYGRALLVLCAKSMGQNDELPVLVENLRNGVTFGDDSNSAIDTTGGGRRERTAHWGSTGVYWRWTEGAVEATAFTLRALLAADPDNELVVPAMTWLVKNRRGAQWKSTRDTAICVLALCDYLTVSGEVSEPVAYRVTVDGQLAGERRLSGEDLLLPAEPFVIAKPTTGAHRVLIERTEGNGPLYWTVSARLFSAEEPIQAHAADVFVRRDVYRLVGRNTLLKGKVYDRVLLADGDTVKSGERLEVVLTVDCPNDLEYLWCATTSPAGLEATVLQSGGNVYAQELRGDEVAKRFGPNSADLAARWATGDGALLDRIGMTGAQRWLYRELRDEAQVFFADRLPAGTWQIRSTLRAEVPGTFHGLPAIAQAMYVPEIRANSRELGITVLPE